VAAQHARESLTTSAQAPADAELSPNDTPVGMDARKRWETLEKERMPVDRLAECRRGSQARAPKAHHRCAPEEKVLAAVLSCHLKAHLREPLEGAMPLEGHSAL
jgi:hypothetical protein